MSTNNTTHFKKIFIVDDEEMFREGAKDYMGTFNKHADIVCCGSGEECIENLHLKPELIVLDHHLATDGSDAMNGLQTLQRIKETSMDTYVVMLTGEDSMQVANETMANGAFDYIVKGATAFRKLEINCTNILKQIADAREIAEFRKFKIGLLAMIGLFIIMLYYFTSVYFNQD